jgi:hypothetical protein
LCGSISQEAANPRSIAVLIKNDAALDPSAPGTCAEGRELEVRSAHACRQRPRCGGILRKHLRSVA